MKAYRDAYNGRAGWRLSFAYDEGIIAALKKRIPPPDRSWDPEEKTWWVAAEWEMDVLELLPAFEPFLRQPALPGLDV